MRQLNAQTAKAAQKALNTPEGKILTEYLTQAVGLMERTFIQTLTEWLIHIVLPSRMVSEQSYL